MFSALQDAARQSPLRLATCDQENSLASATDNGGACLQTELPLIYSRYLRGALDAPAYRSMLDIAKHANTKP